MTSVGFDQFCPVCSSALEVSPFLASSVRDLIVEGRRKLGLTERAFAEIVGVTRSAVQQWERRGGTSPRKDRKDLVAALLGMTTAEFITGGPRPMVAWKRRSVRVVSHVEAGGFTKVDNHMPHGDAETVLVTVDVNRHTFALRVRGDSMRGSGPVSFPEGTIIVVEPDMKPNDGDFVEVLNARKQATFKQYVLIAGVPHLKPLNAAFKTRPLGDNEVIGVVRESITRFK